MKKVYFTVHFYDQNLAQNIQKNVNYHQRATIIVKLDFITSKKNVLLSKPWVNVETRKENIIHTNKSIYNKYVCKFEYPPTIFMSSTILHI